MAKTFIKFRKKFEKNSINLLKNPLSYLNHLLYLPKTNKSNNYSKEL